MTTAKTENLDCRVKSYIQNWEMDVCKKLQSTKVRLMSCTPRDRAHLKDKAETLCAVLDLLQGKNTKETRSTIDLMEEIADLKSKLKAADAKQKETADSLCAEQKMSRDFKLQLEKSHLKQAETEVAADGTSRDLHHQLKELQVDRELVVSNTESESTCLQIPSVEGSDTCVSEEDEKVVRLKISQLKEVLNNAINEAWEAQEATVESQREEIVKLQAAVKLTEEQLEVQRQESTKVLQDKEKEWAERFEEVDSRLKEPKKPRRRSWMFYP